MRSLFWVVLAVSACSPPEVGIDLVTSPALSPLVRESVRFIGDPRLAVHDTGEPLARPRSISITVEERSDCTECYRLERRGSQLVVKGGLPLGVQYGLAHALELHGYRFPHPWKTFVPAAYLPFDDRQLGRDFAPEVDQKRGLHLHTLHPTEALHDFWVPSAKNLEGAKRTIDFVVKNRGNLVSWYALDDVTAGGPTLEAWRAHTSELLAYAKSRGVSTSLTLQLFGKSNLQQAFDLIDDDGAADPLPELERRLHLLFDGLAFDFASLSFGEFFKADPATFVRMVDASHDALQRVRPGIGVTAVVHVGNSETLRVEYQGVRQLYYFLVRHANPAITPWVHTVFYYNLYEDAGGAYLHDDFAEHRAFLEERLRTAQPVGSYPESAYWVGWDVSVPTYLPLYVKSRHLELVRLREAGRLRQFLVFSSGWEWGYWQNDVAALRMAYTLPERWDDALAEQFAPLGAQGRQVSEVIRRLGELEHDALIGQRLGPYLAGRDEILETGKRRGIVSQPGRLSFADVRQLSVEQRAAFVRTVVEPFEAFARALTELERELPAAGEPLVSEVVDGVAVTAARARFSSAAYRAAVQHAAGEPFEPSLAAAEAELTAAETIVARRRRALWDPDPNELLRDHQLPTVYDYGYLREADTLCFWRRERAQLRAVVTGETIFIPACVL